MWSALNNHINSEVYFSGRITCWKGKAETDLHLAMKSLCKRLMTKYSSSKWKFSQGQCCCCQALTWWWYWNKCSLEPPGTGNEFSSGNPAVFPANSLSYDVSLKAMWSQNILLSEGCEFEGTGINFRAWLLFNLSNPHLFTVGLCFDFFCKILEQH